MLLVVTFNCPIFVNSMILVNYYPGIPNMNPVITTDWVGVPIAFI